MSTERKTLKIGGYTYVIRHAPASVALRAAATLANGLSPLINGYRRGAGGDMSKLMLGVAEAFADPALANNVEALCNAFKPYTQVIWHDEQGHEFSKSLWTDREDFYEEHFAGRFDSLLAWLRAAVEYDLGGFLADMKAKMQAAKAAAAAASAASASPASPSESPQAAAKIG